LSGTKTTHPEKLVQGPARLVVLLGPQAGLRCELARRSTLGRAIGSALGLEDSGVSRKHAEIRCTDAGWEIEDLNSRNGTRVNGVQIQSSSKLLVGDKIQLGPNVLLLFTDRGAVEGALIERQKFELLGRVAAGIAHDFNNVLSVLGASASYLRSNKPAVGADPEEMSCLDDMESAVANGARLAHRLLGFARGSRHGRSVVDASAICLEIGQMCRRAFDASIRLELDVNRGLRVLADEGELEQVLMNLCVNARDAMPLGGTLTLRACERMPSTSAAQRLAFSGPHVVLSVEDTGSGIDPSHLPRIFEPFFSTKESGAGFGVGLATVKELVTLHGGIVEAESEPGRGTVFRVYLPTTQGFSPLRTATITPDAQTRRGMGGGRRVLLVDDDELVRRSTGRLLSRAGFQVDEVSNGREALTRYAGGPRPALVLLDLDMPGLDGLETLGELQKIDAKVRVLVVSGHRQPTKEQAVRAAGAGFLGKPFDPAALTDAVRTAMLDDSLWNDDEPTTQS